MRAFVVAAAIASLLLTLGVSASAESSAPGQAKTAKSQIAKKKAQNKKNKARKQKAPAGTGGGMGGRGGGMGGNFGAAPPRSGTETDPPERRGSPDPVREPSPMGTRE